MERRNREIILFFEENEDVKILNGKIVRLYMNRFTINEEERFQIAGVFDLAKVESKEPEIKRPKFMSHMTGKWNYDWSLIENVFGKLDIINWLNTEIHIIMGTSMYIDDLNYKNPLLKLIRFWAQNSCSSTFICLTVLAGRNDGLRTKTQVEDAYQNNHKKDLCEILQNDNTILFHRLRELQKKIEPNSSNDLESFVKNLGHSDSSQIISMKTSFSSHKFSWRLPARHCDHFLDSSYSAFGKLNFGEFRICTSGQTHVYNDARKRLSSVLAEAKRLQNWASPLVKRFAENPDDTLNNDLEDFFEDICRKIDKISITETPIERKLVLYEMTNDDHRFMQSNCKRFTVYLK